MRALLAIVAFLLAVSSARALETRFVNPTYKKSARLNVCYSFGRNCGQPAAKAFCELQGFMQANSFETAHVSPTQVYADGRKCEGSYCVGFTNIVCWTSAAQRGPGHGWPQRID